MRVLPGASLWCVAFGVLPAAIESPYRCPHSLRPGENSRQFPGSAQPSSNAVLPLGSMSAGISVQAILRPADASSVRASTTRPSLENALAASCAGVVHQLHPLAGIDSARLLLFSGDAISYVSKSSAQSSLNDLNCTGDVSLLNGELALPVSWVARVSRLIGNSDTTVN